MVKNMFSLPGGHTVYRVYHISMKTFTICIPQHGSKGLKLSKRHFSVGLGENQRCKELQCRVEIDGWNIFFQSRFFLVLVL